MNLFILKSKIHGFKVTNLNKDYIGSITIDENLMKSANILQYEKVSIYNITNGNRFETYAIYGKAGSLCIEINGAAVHKVAKNDKLIIVSYTLMTEEEAKNFTPKIVINQEREGQNERF